MRDDELIKFVKSKAELLKRTSIWPGQPKMNPGLWLRNFEDSDKKIAALLLDRFVFFNEESTNKLLKASWNSIADGLSKGLNAPGKEKLLEALGTAHFIPVEGEDPNPTDSGYLFCRKARQILNLPEDSFTTTQGAIYAAANGNTIVFLDDFVGSGDQFLKTWERKYKRDKDSVSFKSLQEQTGFVAIYLTLITTSYGLDNIKRDAPKVAVCPTHILEERSTIRGLVEESIFDNKELDDFLEKYSQLLNPKELYMQNPSYKKFGYKNRGLMLGFEHSIPDATLPIFWSPGVDNNWEPLIERL